MTLLENPAAGDLIPGGRGLRKLRVPLPGRGKRGGARVIYFNLSAEEIVLLIAVYAKTERTNMTPSEIKQVI